MQWLYCSRCLVQLPKCFGLYDKQAGKEARNGVERLNQRAREVRRDSALVRACARERECVFGSRECVCDCVCALVIVGEN